MIAKRLLAPAIGALVMATSCQSYRIIDTIPPVDGTNSALDFTFVRIQFFWNEHGRVPSRPDELPELKGRNCSMKDGWGHELNWDSDGISRVTVWSFGRDGKPGGTGEDADVEVVFLGKQKGQDDFPTIRRRGDAAGGTP